MFIQVLSVCLWVLLPCAILTIPAGMFHCKLYFAVTDMKPSIREVILAYIPFLNIARSRKLAYGGAPVYTALMCVCGGLLLFRGVALFTLTTVPVLYVVSAFGMAACIGLYALLYIVNALDFSRMLDCGVVTCVASVLVAPLGYWLLSNQVLPYFKSVGDEVSGRFEDATG